MNDPSPRQGLSWKEFINNHKFKIGIDFTSLISIMGYQLFIFIMIDLDRRKLISINATYQPHLEWVKQQFKNAFLDTDVYPTLCICDNDPIFQSSFERMLQDYFRIKLRRVPYACPEKNGRTERFHLSLKTEAFNNVVPIGLYQAQRICREYQDYYNSHRPHQGINGKIPNKTKKMLKDKVRFVRKEHLGSKIISLEPYLNVAA